MGKRLFVFSFGCRSYFLQIWCRLHFLSVFGHQSIFYCSSKGCLYFFGNILRTFCDVHGHPSRIRPKTRRSLAQKQSTGACAHAPPSGSMWSNGVWIDRDVRIVGGAAVRMRSHQDSRRQAFTACLRFAAREFIFASLPLRFTTYHFSPLFACLCVAGAGVA